MASIVVVPVEIVADGGEVIDVEVSRQAIEFQTLLGNVAFERQVRPAAAPRFVGLALLDRNVIPKIIALAGIWSHVVTDFLPHDLHMPTKSAIGKGRNSNRGATRNNHSDQQPFHDFLLSGGTNCSAYGEIDSCYQK